MNRKKIIRNLGIILFVFGLNTQLNAQCSEAENTTMKKYAELTRTSANTQGCSMCAWLANLYCIAENGLYENDKSEVQKAINDTKANIKLMGEPICCPELLTKTVKWGNPQTRQGSEDVARTNNEIVEDVQEIIQHGINYIDNITQTKENQKNIKNLTEIIEKNSTLLGRRYNSKQEIEDEYQYNLDNINNTSDMFVKSSVKDMELDVERRKMSNDNFTSITANLFGESEAERTQYNAEQLIQKKKNKLYHQKRYLLCQFDVIEAINNDKAITLNKEILQNTLDKTGNDYTAFNNHTLIEGWTPTIKLKEFRNTLWKNGYEYHPKTTFYYTHMGLYGAFGLYELKNSKAYIDIQQGDFGGTAFKKGYNGFSPYWSVFYKVKNSSDNKSSLKFCYTKKEGVVVQVVKQTIFETAIFSTDKLKEYQSILLKTIENKSNLFNIPAEHFNVNIATIDPEPYGYPNTSFQIVVTVIWTDKNQKAYTMVGEIFTSRTEKESEGNETLISDITLKIREGDLSLASEVVLKDFEDFTNYNSDKQLLHGYTENDKF